MKKFFKELLFISYLLEVVMGMKMVKCQTLNQESTSVIGTSVSSVSTKKKHALVVFVHGTVLPFPYFNSLSKVLRNSVLHKKSRWYLEYLNDLRDKSFYKYQPIGDLGFWPILLGPHEGMNAKVTSLFASVFKEMMQRAMPDVYEGFSFYTFGWDGRLDQAARLDAARQLGVGLKGEYDKLTQAGYNVEVTLVNHSHACNVELLMANLFEKEFKNFIIDRVVFLGAPVQKETEAFIASPMFKRIYHLYSRGDMMQVMDTISTQEHYSRRQFEVLDPEVLKKIIQAEVTIDGVGPAHAELWFWGTQEYFFLYRHRLSLYPYPIVVLVPALMKIFDNACQGLSHVKVDIKKCNDDCLISCNSAHKPGVKNSAFKNGHYQETVSLAGFDSLLEVVVNP